MATDPYDEVLQGAKGLSPQQQQKLSDELARLAGIKNGGGRSILELEGLGKEIWEGIDPDEYVRKERDSWDG